MRWSRFTFPFSIAGQSWMNQWLGASNWNRFAERKSPSLFSFLFSCGPICQGRRLGATVKERKGNERSNGRNANRPSLCSFHWLAIHATRPISLISFILWACTRVRSALASQSLFFSLCTCWPTFSLIKGQHKYKDKKEKWHSVYVPENGATRTRCAQRNVNTGPYFSLSFFIYCAGQLLHFFVHCRHFLVNPLLGLYHKEIKETGTYEAQ